MEAALNNDEIDSTIANPTKRLTTAICLANSLELFIKYAHFAINGSFFTFKPFHLEVIKKLEDIAFQKNEKRNLALCLPVGSGKTLMVEYFIAWTFCRNKNLAYLYTSHSHTNIMKLSREIRDMFENFFLSALFGLKLKNDEASKTNWSFEGGINRTGLVAVTTRTGSTGADSGNPATDGYSGALCMEDPMDAADIYSQVKVEEVNMLYGDKLEPRRRTPKTPTVVTMQRLGVNDFIAWIKKSQPENWDIVEIPALQPDGLSFWEERFPVEELEFIKRTNPPKFYSQYQQSPIKLGGNLLKTTSLKHYQELPFLKLRWIECDTAVKTEERHDYTVFQCWGKGYEGGIYLIDQFRGKLEYQDMKQRFIDFWSKHNNNETYNPRQYGSLTVARIEDKSSGSQLIQEARAEGSIPVVGVPRSRSKYERAVTIALPKLNAGYINVPAEAPFMSDFKDEMGTFIGQEDSKQAILKMDKKKTFDDQVDCFISACEHGFSEFVSSSDVVDSFMKKKMENLKRRRRR